MSDRALSLLIHGGPRSGKSTLAMTAPYPRLLLDVEASARFLNVNKIYWNPMTSAPPEADGTWDTCVVAVQDFDTALQAYAWLKSGNHPFRSVILDSIKELQVKAQEAVNGREKMQTQHWGELLMKVSFFGRDLRDLTSPSQVNQLEAVVVLAPTMDRGDGIQRPSLQGGVADQVPYWYDIAGYLYPNQEVDAGGQPHTVRHLYIGDNPMFISGSRAAGLPEDIANPNIEELISTIFGPKA
jgi:hypothetical protein